MMTRSKSQEVTSTSNVEFDEPELAIIIEPNLDLCMYIVKLKYFVDVDVDSNDGSKNYRSNINLILLSLQ